MTNTLEPKMNFTRRLTIDSSRTIDFMGEAVRVYATPEVVRDIEVTCRNGVLTYLPPGQDTVGARIELDHIAPSLLGAEVEISASIVSVEGRSVTFDVSVREGQEEVARGKHKRFIVDVDKLAARLKAKADKNSTPKATAS
jgi:predicted thioesterase